MLSRHILTLKECSKVKYDTNKTFAAYNILNVDCTLQSSRTNNKRDIGTFMLRCHHLTLKEWSKVKSDTTKIFAPDGFLKVDCTL